MKQVGVYDAKTNLAKLLDEVERGETVTITRHGRPVAKLVPVTGANKRTVEETIQAIREFRRGRSLGGLNIKELIEEGRRF
jgi:prevent-host-death family protein